MSTCTFFNESEESSIDATFMVSRSVVLVIRVPQGPISVGFAGTDRVHLGQQNPLLPVYQTAHNHLLYMFCRKSKRAHQRLRLGFTGSVRSGCGARLSDRRN